MKSTKKDVPTNGKASAVEHIVFDEATMNMLYKRREDHRNGISKSYTVEECMDFIRKSKQVKPDEKC